MMRIMVFNVSSSGFAFILDVAPNDIAILCQRLKPYLTLSHL
jgi:hypothetical protein